MTVIQFPTTRIVRYYPTQQQHVSPMALLLIPAAMWVGCVTWWIDRMLDADAAVTAAAVKEQVRR